MIQTINEQESAKVAADRNLLRRRLLDAKAVLKDEYRQHFKDYRFDFENKRLIAATGRYWLQWQLRDRPDLPVSYSNQQTNQGCVFLMERLESV
jgi:hypothetical protein